MSSSIGIATKCLWIALDLVYLADAINEYETYDQSTLKLRMLLIE